MAAEIGRLKEVEMLWYEVKSMRFWVLTLMVCTSIITLACKQDPFNSPEPDTVVLDPGLNAFMIVSQSNASIGSSVWIEGKIRVVDEGVTPTAFVADLRYDPERLTPVQDEGLTDGVLRMANLGAGHGLVKIAGAAASGLETETLFRVHFTVVGNGYLEGLDLILGELDVVENNFADVAHQVRVSPTPVGPQTVVKDREY